jgi:hypothetical protein
VADEFRVLRQSGLEAVLVRLVIWRRRGMTVARNGMAFRDISLDTADPSAAGHHVDVVENGPSGMKGGI